MAGASVYTVDDGRGHCTGSADLHRNPHAVRRPRRRRLSDQYFHCVLPSEDLGEIDLPQCTR